MAAKRLSLIQSVILKMANITSRNLARFSAIRFGLLLQQTKKLLAAACPVNRIRLERIWQIPTHMKLTTLATRTVKRTAKRRKENAIWTNLVHIRICWPTF